MRYVGNTARDYFRIYNGKHQFRESTTGEWKNIHVSSTNGDTEYAALEVAKRLSEDAAYKSISMGLGQQMGFNFKVCGYKSAKEMFDDYSKGEDRQIDGMFSFVQNYDKRMFQALKEKNYETFVRYYNGAKIGSGANEDYTNKMKNYERQYRNLNRGE
ncbi:MAG: N-acetylmuramidase domain-containing protein [Clostridia bacterium]|nr:N-acetylmuramidase domain-containing protein [Clostridia bacterium]